MAGGGYTIVADTRFARHLPRPVVADLCVGIMEHVRRQFPTWEPRLPSACEFDLIAGGHPHNVGPVLMLGLYVPPGVAVPPAVLDLFHLDGLFETWCDRTTVDELLAIGNATSAPTWAELVRLKSYPIREPPPDARL